MRQTGWFEEMVFVGRPQKPPSKRLGRRGAIMGGERQMVTHLRPGSVEEEAMGSYTLGDRLPGQPVTGGPPCC